MPGIALGKEDMGVAAWAQTPVWDSAGCIHELWLSVSISLLCGTVGFHAGEVRGLPSLSVCVPGSPAMLRRVQHCKRWRLEELLQCQVQ